MRTREELARARRQRQELERKVTKLQSVVRSRDRADTKAGGPSQADQSGLGVGNSRDSAKQSLLDKVPIPAVFFDQITQEPIRPIKQLKCVSIFIYSICMVVAILSFLFYLDETQTVENSVVTPVILAGYSCSALQKESISMSSNSEWITNCSYLGKNWSQCLSVEQFEGTATLTYFPSYEDCTLNDPSMWTLSVRNSTGGNASSLYTYVGYTAPGEREFEKATSAHQPDINVSGFGYYSCAGYDTSPGSVTPCTFSLDLTYRDGTTNNESDNVITVPITVYQKKKLHVASDPVGPAPWCCGGIHDMETESARYVHTSAETYVWNPQTQSMGTSRSVVLQGSTIIEEPVQTQRLGEMHSLADAPGFVSLQESGLETRVASRTFVRPLSGVAAQGSLLSETYAGPEKYEACAAVTVGVTAYDTIFCAPYNADKVLRISTHDEASIQMTDNTYNTYANQYRSCVSDGRSFQPEIWCAPFGETRVLRISPALNTSSQLSQTFATNGNGYVACAEVEHNIWCAPYYAASSQGYILKIDTSLGTSSQLLGPVANPIYGDFAYASCSAVGNDIWCAPFGGNTVLKIATDASSVLPNPGFSETTASSSSGAVNQYYACELVSSILWCPPYNSSDEVIRIDTSNFGSSTFFGLSGLSATGYRYAACAQASSGNTKYILCAPLDGEKMLTIDTSTNTLSLSSVAGSGRHKYMGCAGQGGSEVWCAPYNATRALDMDAAAGANYELLDRLYLQEKQYKTCITSGPAALVSVWCVPYNAERVLKISQGSTASPSAATQTPTAGPQTLNPSVAPTPSPTGSPTLTVAPTGSPATVAPTQSPATSAPTVSPLTTSPTVTFAPTSSPSSLSWSAMVTTKVGRFCEPSNLTGLTQLNTSPKTYSVAPGIWNLTGGGSSPCNFSCACLPLSASKKEALKAGILSQLRVGWQASLDVDLCAPWRDIPPYICTQESKLKPNSFFASLSLALGNVTLFYFGVTVAFVGWFASEPCKSCSKDGNKGKKFSCKECTGDVARVFCEACLGGGDERGGENREKRRIEGWSGTGDTESSVEMSGVAARRGDHKSTALHL